MHDFDDLVFENRNKEYGAYQLRRKYFSNVIIGLIFSILLACLITIIPFLTVLSTEKVIYSGSRYIPVTINLLEPPKEVIIMPPAPAPSILPKVKEMAKYVAPEVVDTLTPDQSTQISNDELLLSSNDTSLIETGKGSGLDLLLTGNETGLDDPFIFVETMPTFQGGGISKFQEWVRRRTNYPQEAIDNRISGTVILSFIVEKDGFVSNVTVLKGVNPILDNEARNVISASPKWSPGKQRGQPVRIRYVIPINFAPSGM